MCDVREQLPNDEKIARFIVKTKWVNRIHNTVSPQAFLPPRSNELSVARHGLRDESSIWDQGQAMVEERKRTEIQTLELVGRADLFAGDVRFPEFPSVDAVKDEPPPFHGVLIGWPPEKEKRISLAQQLAACCRLIFSPNWGSSE